MDYAASPTAKRIQRRRPLGLALLFPILCLACASVTVEPFQPTTIHKTPAEKIVVLTAFPSAAYLAIGRIEVRDRGLGRSEAQLRRKLIAAASELGADAVVLERTSTRRSVGGLLEPIVLYDDLLVSGVAIVQQPHGSARSR